MARPSKPRFPIYEDSGIPTPEPECTPNDDPFNDQKDRTIVHQHGYNADGSVLPSIEKSVANILPTDTEFDKDARRESGISSMPESPTETDQEQSLPHSTIRPSFRRHLAGSPFEKSPKRSGLHPRSRTATPRSARSKGSPLPRKQIHEEGPEGGRKEYPLVLLHITILPVELRWSVENMREILPPGTVESVQLLRSKLSETIMQRGILIPHPREEYELLEERLLEALELRKERITKCGHFRARESMSSISSAEESISSGDSGMGSSIEDLCAICHDHLRPRHRDPDSRLAKWSIKVYAANGLMKASAWNAAWSEMERVDVEIVPNIDKALCRLLDAKTAEEEAEKRLRQEEERIAHEQRERADDTEYQKHANFTREILYLAQTPATDEPPPVPHETKPTVDDLPQVYRPKDIPLSLLLRNYIILLAQDTRNIVIFVLAVLALWLGLNAMLPSTVEVPSSAILHTDTPSALNVAPPSTGVGLPDFSDEMSAPSLPEALDTITTNATPSAESAPNVEEYSTVSEEHTGVAELVTEMVAGSEVPLEVQFMITNEADLLQGPSGTIGPVEVESEERKLKIAEESGKRFTNTGADLKNIRMSEMSEMSTLEEKVRTCKNEAAPNSLFAPLDPAQMMSTAVGICENEASPRYVFTNTGRTVLPA